MCVQALGGQEGFSTDYFVEDGDVEYPKKKKKKKNQLETQIKRNQINIEGEEK